MALILTIETATKVCSVALGKDGKLLALKESMDEKYTHSENLTTYIQDVLSRAKIDLKDLDAIAVSKGPGSYTGLRIGVSTAKGLCFALDKPLIGIETLKVMAAGFINNSSFRHSDSLFCPMLDARRMEVYCAVYNSFLKEVQKTSAEIIDENSFSGILKDKEIYFFGEGAGKCKNTLSEKTNARFIEKFFPSSEYIIPFAEEAFLEKKLEDLAYFEPYYLKDFVSNNLLKNQGGLTSF